jgi:hypothetical protein
VDVVGVTRFDGGGVWFMRLGAVIVVMMIIGSG